MTIRPAALCLAVLLPGCCGFPGEDLRTYPGLKDPEVIEHLRARQAQIGTLMAEGKGSLSGQKGSEGSFTWQSWSQGSSRLRLVLRHPGVGLLADVLVEGDRASCYDPEAGTLTKGPLDALSVPGLAQTACLVRLLSGPADTLAFPESDGGRMALDIGNGRSWRILLDREHLTYETAELRAGDEILSRVTFEPGEYRMTGQIPWPMRMLVDQPGADWKLKLRFTEVQPGAPLDPEVFKLKVPEGTKVVEARPVPVG